MSPQAGIITQTRMTSTRLPGKVLKRINNLSLLEYHLMRLQWADLPVVVATTTNGTDDVLVQLCQNLKMDFFRGDEEDVLSRYYLAALQWRFDPIIRVTSDCPLIDGKMIREALEDFQDCHYLTNSLVRTFPRGFDFEIFSLEALEIAYREGTETHEREHVTPYIYSGKQKNFKIKHFTGREDVSHFRVTVDTEEDFELLNELIEKFHCHALSSQEIIEILKQNPYLREINSQVKQKDLRE